MDQDDIAKLNRNRMELVRDMDTPSILDYLLSKFILNMHHADEINKLQDSKDKNRKLLDILQTMGAPAFHKFLEALREAQQHDLAKLFEKQEQLANIRNAIKRLASTELNIKHILQQVQKSLKKMYSVRFKTVYPFSLPFTFDIENTWVSLALKEDSKHATEEHAELLRRAFEKANMLIIEGNPATGKTSLMRRLAYEWAKGKQELCHFDLIVYSEFREVRERSFESIADLVQCYSKNNLDNEDFERLALLMNNKQFCKAHRILVLLDGYDESSLDKQCSELSTYLSAKTIRYAPLFNIVITTRKGYLSNFRGREGRFVYADVLGFTTDKQKYNYISNHFSTKEEVESTVKIAAIHRLLKTNEHFNKLSETPLFLTFICLVHERMVDGTVLELYCSIILWLIDRHQQDFPDRDIPGLFDFQSDSDDKFKTILDNYLQFPQLHCLGHMAVKNSEKSVFEEFDCHQFNLKLILQQVGLLRKEQNYSKSCRLETKFSFPHRTIQEFLAALCCLLSAELSNEWLTPHDDEGEMNEFQKFLLRFALCNEMPLISTRRETYFQQITILKLDFNFDSFCSPAGINSSLLNNFLSQCSSIEKLILHGNNEEIELHELINLSKMTKLNKLCIESVNITYKNDANTMFYLPNCLSLETLYFRSCKVKSSGTLDFTKLSSIKNLKFRDCETDFIAIVVVSLPNCLSLRNLYFGSCKMKSSGILDFTKLSSIKTLDFLDCETDFIATVLVSLPNCLSLESLFFGSCKVKNSGTLDFTKLSSIKHMKFRNCETDFIAAVLVSLPYGLSLETLYFRSCKMKSSGTLDFTKLSSIKNLDFRDCETDFIASVLVSLPNCLSLETLYFGSCKMKSSGTLDFTKLSSIKNLKFFRCITDYIATVLVSLPNCLSLETLYFRSCKMNCSGTLDFIKLSSIKTLDFTDCEILANVLFSFPNCLSLETLEFVSCKMKSNGTLDFTKVSSINNLMFNSCETDFIAIVLVSLPNCLSLETLTFDECIIESNSTLDFIKLSSFKNLKFNSCETGFIANILLSLLNCPALETLEFSSCLLNSCATLNFTKLSSVNNLKFNNCKRNFITNVLDCLTNSLSLENLEFSSCEVKSNGTLGFTKLSSIKNLKFDNSEQT